MIDEILVARDGPVMTITLNRPEKFNALTFPMYARLAELCEVDARDGTVRALVITGAGAKAFAAGTDINQFREFKSPEDGLGYEARVDQIMSAIERCPVPTIAAISGACTGGGAARNAVTDGQRFPQFLQLFLPREGLHGGIVHPGGEALGDDPGHTVKLLVVLDNHEPSRRAAHPISGERTQRHVSNYQARQVLIEHAEHVGKARIGDTHDGAGIRAATNRVPRPEMSPAPTVRHKSPGRSVWAAQAAASSSVGTQATSAHGR